MLCHSLRECDKVQNCSDMARATWARTFIYRRFEEIDVPTVGRSVTLLCLGIFKSLAIERTFSDSDVWKENELAFICFP